jgi:nucleoid-associated protein EbfC
VEPGGEQLDMQQLFAAAAAMQSQIMNAQQELADAEVLGTAGGGLVTVTVNGQGELVDVTIQPDAIDPADPAETAESIADLILAAYRAACGAVDDLQQQTMAPFANLGGGLPGMPDLAGLTGQPGGAGAAESGPGPAEPGPRDAGSSSPAEPSDGDGDTPTSGN